MTESRTRSAGFTFVEMMVASVVAILVAAGVYAILSTGTDTYATEAVSTDLERQAARALAAISNEISMAGSVTIFPQQSPPLSAAGLGLQKSEGYSGGAVVWGPLVLLTFDYDLDDPNDGKDNDGDGCVDEGLLVLRQDPGGPNDRTVVLARHVREYLEGEEPNGLDDNGNGLVDERGLCVSVSGGVYTIRLTLERKDSNGRLLTRTVETSVTPRN